MDQAKTPKKAKKTQSRLQRIDQAVARIMEGEDADPLLRILGAADQELLQQALKTLRQDPTLSDAYMRDLWRLDYEKRPPTMQEFLEDPYWLGSITNKSDESEGMFPMWKSLLIKDFDLDSRVHNLLVSGSLGIGKCLKIDTPIRMYDGSVKAVQDVVKGDMIMGDDGEKRNVLSLAHGSETMYDVVPLRPRGGLEWGCNASHLLTLKCPITGNLVEVAAKDVANNQKKYLAYRLVRTGFELPARELPIDPYWLGLWLGDGSCNTAGIVIADKDQQILEYHKNFCSKFPGMTMSVSRTDIRGNKCRLYYPVFKGQRNNPIIDLLRSIGLLIRLRAKGGRKFIPDLYLQNSVDNRKKLLAGIVDTDGGMAFRCYDIALADRNLALQIQDLSWSLGASCGIRKKIVNNPIFKKPAVAWRLLISGIEIPTVLERKKIPQDNPRSCKGKRRTSGVTGFKIVDKGIGNYYGFEIDGNRRFILADGTITHNTWITVTIMLYRIVLARLLRNPQSFFGLSKGSAIFYATLSVTRSVVQETAFGDFLNFMGSSPFFVEECNFDPEKKYANFRIPLGHSIYMTAGSQGWHILGRNAMGVALDEGNFRLESNPDLKAYALYDEVRTRIRNRFEKLSGFLPAISILSSSAKDESSFTEKVKADIETSCKTDPHQRVYSFAVYHIKAHTLTLGKRWFRVAYGLKNVDPQVLHGWYDKDGRVLSLDCENPPPGAKIEYVPENYLEDYKRNTKKALQNTSGIATGGSFRFFGNMVDVEKAIIAGGERGLINPCKVTSIPLSEEDSTNIWDYLEVQSFLTKQLSRIVPKRDPDALRYAHLDLATRSQAGLSICHAAGNKLVDGLVKDGKVFEEYRVIVEYDFILSIIAGKEKPISFEKVINFFFWLRDLCGFRFALITSDQFQSVMPLQTLEKKGFKVANLSVDKTKRPYDTWRSGFEEQRINMFRHNVMMSEAEKLVDLADRVDHLPNESKDVCDSACGCHYSAVTFKDDTITRSAHGAEPSIYTNMAVDGSEEKPPIEVVNLDEYKKKTKTFHV